MTFAQAVTNRTQQLNTRLCVGLDPRLAEYRDLAHLREHTLAVLEATAPYAACVKPQLAFYEANGIAGMQILEEVCALARTLDLPVLLDGKRGDIGSTAEAYAQGWLAGQYAGSALTVNPFLGFETLRPFIKVAQANAGAIFVLVKTSNAGQADVQGSGVSERIAVEIARLNSLEINSSLEINLEINGANYTGSYASVGAVVGATHPHELSRFRALMPNAILLLPGLGAQGAKAANLAGAFYPDGTGAVVSASRGVQYADKLNVEASSTAAKTFRDELNAALKIKSRK